MSKYENKLTQNQQYNKSYRNSAKSTEIYFHLLWMLVSTPVLEDTLSLIYKTNSEANNQLANR